MLVEELVLEETVDTKESETESVWMRERKMGSYLEQDFEVVTNIMKALGSLSFCNAFPGALTAAR